MVPPRAATLIKFLTERLDLSVEELLALRDGIEVHVQGRVGVPARPRSRRTLYLPSDPLDDL